MQATLPLLLHLDALFFVHLLLFSLVIQSAYSPHLGNSEGKKRRIKTMIVAPGFPCRVLMAAKKIVPFFNWMMMMMVIMVTVEL